MEFEAASIMQAEEEYKNLSVSEDQKEKVDAFARVLNQFIPISERALKGFLWRASQEYQVKHHVKLAEGKEQMNPTLVQRLQVVTEMFSILKKDLTRILVSKEQEPLLDEAINKATEYYKGHYANE